MEDLRVRLDSLDARYEKRQTQGTPGFKESVRRIFAKRVPIPDTFSRASVVEVCDTHCYK